MSRGSTLTLYRVYRQFKVTDAQYEQALWGYRRVKEECGCPFDPKDIPLVMSLKPFDEYTEDGKGIRRYVEPRDVEEFRGKHYTGFFLQDDRRWCDRLLQWDFASGFDALVEHYSLSGYDYRNSQVTISRGEAVQMLTAIEYILGGVWDDHLEASMHNPFVRLFTEGYGCAAYWKYVNRRRYDSARRVFDFEQCGCKVRVQLPPQKKDYDEDDYECAEDNEIVECWLRTFASGLRAFLESDNWSLDDKVELLLVYGAWC